jgi:RecB family exonuclease
MSRERLLPEIPPVSPSSLDDWTRCPRLYLDRHLLRLPESDAGPAAVTGNLVHDLLRHLHGQGDCHDAALRTATLDNHGVPADGPVAAMLARHADRCPSPAPARGHELEVVRVARRGPVWIGTGRLDAVWEHDGILDVRDYKTGTPRDGSLADDVRARMQAWLAAPLAGGLRLRVRYEHLGFDAGADPVEFEPDAEDLARIETEIDAAVTAIRDAAARREFHGVADAELCRSCAYRSICPDSATPGEPTWPVPEAALE